MSIARLKGKLEELKKMDPGCSVFGAKEHQYKLNPCLTEEEILNFEKRFSIILPADYRDFLSLVGNGGAGPGYGLFALEDRINDIPLSNPSHLSKSFPHTSKWNVSRNMATSYDSEIVAQMKRDKEY